MGKTQEKKARGAQPGNPASRKTRTERKPRATAAREAAAPAKTERPVKKTERPVKKAERPVAEPVAPAELPKRDTSSLAIEEKYLELARLLNLGRERGFVLVDEILEVLPEEISSAPEDLDEIYLRFTENDIEIVDSQEKLVTLEDGSTGERQETTEAVPGATLVDPALLEKTNDPVRMYLREMGTVKLLDRKGEVSIARRIESGEARVFCALASSTHILELFLRANEMARRDRRMMRDVLSGLSSELDERGRTRVGEALKVFIRIRDLDEQVKGLKERLRRCKKASRRSDELVQQIDALAGQVSVEVRSTDFTTTTRNRLLTFLGEVERQFSIPITTIRKDETRLKTERNAERRSFYEDRVKRYKHELGTIEERFGVP